MTEQQTTPESVFRIKYTHPKTGEFWGATYQGEHRIVKAKAETRAEELNKAYGAGGWKYKAVQTGVAA